MLEVVKLVMLLVLSMVMVVVIVLFILFKNSKSWGHFDAGDDFLGVI